MSNEDNLTLKEQGAVIVEAGLNAIPVVGGSLATLYFGAKQEKQFKRLERFYSELQQRVESAENIDISKVDQSALASIIEEINESVEADFTENRLEYFQNCFLNSLRAGGEADHDKKRYFISKLLRLSDFDIDVLVALYKAPEGHVLAYDKQDQDGAGDYNASLERLKSDGFLNSRLNGKLKAGIEWGEITAFYLSGFGRDFVEYCLATTHNNQVQLTAESGS